MLTAYALAPAMASALPGGQPKSTNMRYEAMRYCNPATVIRAIVVASVFSVGVSPLIAQTDNTKTNKRDRAKGAVTADQQKENATDRDITQKVRRAVMQDKTLSTYAHNVKIITQHGAVTLKGPVRSEQERTAVEAKATEIVGAGHVTNKMSITATHPKK